MLTRNFLRAVGVEDTAIGPDAVLLGGSSLDLEHHDVVGGVPQAQERGHHIFERTWKQSFNITPKTIITQLKIRLWVWVWLAKLKF